MASRPRYLRSIRLLAECYHAFERLSGRNVRELGLTPGQFDIVATLGNTEGMTLGELGRRTLTTKGTLTGIVDRLEAKGLVRRASSPSDGRSTVARLTPQGERLFAEVFDGHIAHCGSAFTGYREADFEALDAQLRRLCDTLSANAPE